VTVFDECDRRIDDGDVTVDLFEMTVGIARTPSGRYVVGYTARGIGGVSGTTSSSFSFTVHAGPSCGPGHGDHGGHDDDPDGGRRRGGHGRGEHDPGRHDRGGHDMSGSGGHKGMQHPSATHPAGGHGGKAHERASRHGRHRREHGGRHRGTGEGPPEGSAQSDNRSGPLAIGHNAGDLPVDQQAVLVALALATGLGILGGWVIRVATRS
ncbi:MAG: hypothetical protein ABR575_10060, partial [Actinomycetota bacterium]